MQYAIVIEKVVTVELDFLEFFYISRYYKFYSPLLDRINSTSQWPAQNTFFILIVHSGNLKRISAGDFGACNYTDFVAEAVGDCEQKFYSNLATDLTADCRYVYVVQQTFQVLKKDSCLEECESSIQKLFTLVFFIAFVCFSCCCVVVFFVFFFLMAVVISLKSSNDPVTGRFRKLCI